MSPRVLINISIVLYSFFSFGAHGQINFNGKDLTLSNDVIHKSISVSSRDAGHIIVKQLVDKKNNKELLNPSSNTLPWFEFVVNEHLVTSNDPYWKYMGYTTRGLSNSGIEYLLHFRAEAGPVKGLSVTIKEQFFPGSTLIREQLVLSAEKEKRFKLNNLHGKQHFVFPQYSYNKEEVPLKSTEIRIANWNGEVLESLDCSSFDSRRDHGFDLNLSNAHMFHPQVIIKRMTQEDELVIKGPLGIISDGSYSFMMAYEHASQDTLIQGIKGKRDPEQAQKDLNFLKIVQKSAAGKVSSAIEVVRGGYLDGEEISRDKLYKSIWGASGFYLNKEKNAQKKLLHDYLLKWITEFPQTRDTKFYYNTWGMQQEESTRGNDIRAVLNYERIFEEIRHAHQLGVEVFVLDDGWEEMMGLWKPNKRLKDGFEPILDTLKSYGMTLGVWMSPLAIDPRTERYQQHEDWLIRDEEGKLIKGQGDVPVIDFVSEFANLFVQDCKWLIDHGVRFFKWDALGTYYPYRTNALHGNEKENTKEEIIARYGYLFPIYMKRAMAELNRYNPEVVIEIDLTENVRALMGLSTISAGKLFFMNNGGSVYGDYSQYRAKSMRNVVNAYNDFIPLQLFTYANYPQDISPFWSERYNINSSIIAGSGLWGNLNIMNDQQRDRGGDLIRKAKQVRPFITHTTTLIKGSIGTTPEIYTKVNTKKAAGQVVAFSGGAMHYTHEVVLNSNHYLGVLNNSFQLKKDTLQLFFQFPTPDASREAFILPNQGSGIKILSSTSWMDEIQLKNNELSIVSGAPGQVEILWPKNIGYPLVNGEQVSSQIKEEDLYYLIELVISKSKERVRIQ